MPTVLPQSGHLGALVVPGAAGEVGAPARAVDDDRLDADPGDLETSERLPLLQAPREPARRRARSRRERRSAVGLYGLVVGGGRLVLDRRGCRVPGGELLFEGRLEAVLLEAAVEVGDGIAPEEHGRRVGEHEQAERR